ncbi:putative porin [Parvicella tangerina]|uniref:Porin n=1 Tax=Parvicella tangerina TaxID=2829795 RepID=A0A916JLU1_9FLAO|nr:putative porin [Parvicella tangerina]CAG5080422.1 hypothetical protein CRYO30217_01304 [Parvicella tangerina]
MKLPVLIIFVSLTTFHFGQKPFYYIENGSVKQIDTVSLNGVEDYGRNDFVLNLGNHGSPEFKLTPKLADLINNDYSLLTFQPKHTFRRYKLYKPIVDAKYTVGTAQEQHFSLLHSQNVSERVNYAIGLRKINSNGIYQNQETNFTDVFFNSYGTDLLNKKYSYNLEFNYLNRASSLNGGLANDSAFTNDTIDLQNRELLEINLPFAYQELKKWYGKINQEVNLFSQLDSNENGSLISLSNYFEYEHNSRLYYDSLLNSIFYDRILDDSTITNETMSFQQLSGYLGMKYKNKKENGQLTLLKIGSEVAQNWYKQDGVDTTQLDVLLDISGAFQTSDYSLNGQAAYLLNDAYENNDYEVDFNGSYTGLSKLGFNARIYLSNQRPQLDLLQYSSNHVTWKNTFEKYQLTHFMLGADYEGKWDASVSVNYFDVKNPIYFGYDKTPYQAPGLAQLIRTTLSARNKNNKRWDLGGEVHYQYQGGYNVFRLPNFLAKVNAAINFKVFNKKMAAAIGTEVVYFSSYESKRFDPVTGQFYIFSNEKLGNYPYANVFIKSRVQRATFFLMMSHPHQGLLGYDYFYVPGYPANDRFFRVGVSWLFVN